MYFLCDSNYRGTYSMSSSYWANLCCIYAISCYRSRYYCCYFMFIGAMSRSSGASGARAIFYYGPLNMDLGMGFTRSGLKVL